MSPLPFVASANRPAAALIFARRTAGLRLRILAPFSSAASANDGDGTGGDAARSGAAAAGDNSRSSSGAERPVRRRTRRRTLQSADGGAVPSLADFVHRARVLRQYRSFVRLAQFVDGRDSSDGGDVASGECRAALEEVRLSFKMGMKKDVDDLSKNMAYSEVRSAVRGTPITCLYPSCAFLHNHTRSFTHAGVCTM